MTYFEYLAEVTRAYGVHPSWRWGQALFNVLEMVRPELASLVRGSEIDPYFVTAQNDDYRERVIRFYNFLWENWE
jgi:hypothetical protein